MAKEKSSICWAAYSVGTSCVWVFLLGPRGIFVRQTLGISNHLGHPLPPTWLSLSFDLFGKERSICCTDTSLSNSFSNRFCSSIILVISSPTESVSSSAWTCQRKVMHQHQLAWQHHTVTMPITSIFIMRLIFLTVFTTLMTWFPHDCRTTSTKYSKNVCLKPHSSGNLCRITCGSTLIAPTRASLSSVVRSTAWTCRRLNVLLK